MTTENNAAPSGLTESWIHGAAIELWKTADVAGFEDFKLAVRGFLLAAAPKAAEQAGQEPVATLHDDGHWSWKGTPPYGSNFAGWRMDVYAAPLPRASDEAASVDACVMAVPDCNGSHDYSLIRKGAPECTVCTGEVAQPDEHNIEDAQDLIERGAK